MTLFDHYSYGHSTSLKEAADALDQLAIRRTREAERAKDRESPREGA